MSFASISSFSSVAVSKKPGPAPVLPNVITLNYVGTGVAGSTGDGGQASSAKLNIPCAVWVDNSNNLYIAEWSGQRVRKVNMTTGIISTIAGTGTAGSTGLGGPATSCQLNNPGGVAVDSLGNVYISDFSNHRILRIDYLTANIYAIASGSGNNINLPLALTFDNSSNLIITNDGNSTYVRLTYPGYTTATTASSATVIANQAGSPTTVAYNPINKYLFVNNWYSTGVFGYFQINGSGTYTGQTLTNLESKIGNRNVRGICIDSSQRVYVLNTDATLFISDSTYTTFTQFSQNSSLGMSITYNVNMYIDASNNLYIPDDLNNRIIKIANITN